MTMNIASTENATGLECNISVTFILTCIVLRECVIPHVDNMAGICCRSLSHYTANFISVVFSPVILMSLHPKGSGYCLSGNAVQGRAEPLILTKQTGVAVP